VGGADAHDGAFGLPVGDLALQQGGQVLLVWPCEPELAPV